MEDKIFDNENAWMWIVLLLLCFANNGNAPDFNKLQSIGDETRDIYEQLNAKELPLERLRDAANTMHAEIHKET